MSQYKSTLPSMIQDELDLLKKEGIEYEIRSGAKHMQLWINGRMVTILPRGKNSGNNQFSATHNTVTHIKRFARQELNLHRAKTSYTQPPKDEVREQPTQPKEPWTGWKPKPSKLADILPIELTQAVAEIHQQKAITPKLQPKKEEPMTPKQQEALDNLRASSEAINPQDIKTLVNHMKATATGIELIFEMLDKVLTQHQELIPKKREDRTPERNAILRMMNDGYTWTNNLLHERLQQVNELNPISQNSCWTLLLKLVDEKLVIRENKSNFRIAKMTNPNKQEA